MIEYELCPVDGWEATIKRRPQDDRHAVAGPNPPTYIYECRHNEDHWGPIPEDFEPDDEQGTSPDR